MIGSLGVTEGEYSSFVMGWILEVFLLLGFVVRGRVPRGAAVFLNKQCYNEKEARSLIML